MIGLLTIAGIALLALRKKHSVSGIGAVQKRRIYREIEQLQPTVDFTLKFDELDDNAKGLVLHSTQSYNSQYPKRAPLSSQKYYNQLRRAYNAISGVGATRLPYKQYDVYNHRGDLILSHRDYGTPTEHFWNAVNYIETSRANSYEDLGYWDAVVAIATGTRLVWEDKGVHKGVESVVFGDKAPTERKYRISYLATPKKGGIYPEQLIHIIYESAPDGDYMDIYNGVANAIREVHSVKQAKEMILNKYEQEHQIESRFSEVPF